MSDAESSRGNPGGHRSRSGRGYLDAVTAGLQLPGSPEQPRAGQVVLRPLERGLGHTLGITMRRILLSSLRGAAVWAFRVDGMLHEHQTVVGVVEDVHEIIRNLKSLVLRMDDDADEAVLELRVSKAGPVTARAITAHPSVEIVNPDHHILELHDDRDLRLELYVNKGRGYVPAEAHSIPREMPDDLVRVDAIYNPVTRANFVVEETRVGQRTDFDRLVLEVETNGAVDVPSAVQYAARLAIEHLAFLAGGSPVWRADRVWGDLLTPAASTLPGRVSIPPRLLELLNRRIEELTELSVRSRSSLQKENIHTVRDLVQRTEQQMLDLENFGKKSLQEISDFLAEHGLRFGSPLEIDENGTLWWVLGLDEDTPESREKQIQPRVTVLVDTGAFRLPLEVRDTNLRLVARARAGEEICIPAGRYLIGALLPNGESLETIIDATGSDLIQVDLRTQVPPAEDEHTFTPDADVPKGRRTPTTVLAAAGAATGALFAPSLGPVAALLSALSPEGLSQADAPIQHKEFFLGVYALQELHFSPAGERSPEFRVIDRGANWLRLRVAGQETAVMFGQISIPGISPLNFALPVFGRGAKECELLIAEDADVIKVGPKFGYSPADLALAYMHAGDLRAAGDAFTPDDVLQLLNGQEEHPVLAAIGCYLLLRLDRLNLVDRWPITLSARYPRFADGLIVAGEMAARAGDHETASNFFIQAVQHGLPMFSDGFSVLFSRLRQLGHTSAANVLSPHQRDRCAELSRVLSRWAPFLRTDLQLLAFSGAAPGDPAGSQVPFDVTGPPEHTTEALQ